MRKSHKNNGNKAKSSDFYKQLIVLNKNLVDIVLLIVI